MFGQQQKKPFGFGGTSTFGQNTNTFGQPQASVFGQTSTFGTTTTPQSGGIFGAAQPSGGLFGQSTSTFGQPQQQQQGSSFFGATQQPAQPSLFGQTAQPQQQAFGSTSFGAQPRPAFGGFGTTTPASSGGLFGQQNTTTTGGSIFGGTTSTSNVFGGGTSFGATPVGTTIPYKPLHGSDTMMKNGSQASIQTHLQCITCMKEYESKSLEELRVEDYLANRKQGNQGTGAFSTPAASTTGTGLFGTTTTPASTGFGFGNTAQSKPLFGAGGFGTTTQQPASTFGQPTSATPFGMTTSTATSVFGQTPTNTAFGFGNAAAKPAFGAFGTSAAPATTQTASTSFGAAKPFGTTSFGAPSSTPFGTTNTANQAKPALGFGTGFGTTGFGNTTASSAPFSFGTTTTTPSTNLFGAKPATTGGFGTSTTPFSFSTPATGSTFGAPVNSMAKSFTGTTGFGSTPGLFNTSFGQPATAPPTANIDTARAQQLILMTTLPISGDSFFKVDPKKDQMRPTSIAAQKAVLEEMTFKPKTPPASRTKNVPVARHPTVSLFAGLEDGEATLLNIQSPKQFTIVPKTPPKHMGLSIFESSLNKPAEHHEGEASQPNDSVLEVGPSKSSPIASTPIHPVTRSPPQRDGMDTIQEDSSLHLSNERSIISPRGHDDEAYNFENENSVGVSLKRAGYYTKPTLQSLKLDDKGECWVEDFVVGRRGYGSVKFLGGINIQGLDLDSVLIFRRKEITVYPDESKKPPLGQGLNRRAEITLESVYPPNRALGELVTNPEDLVRMKFREKLEHYSTKMGARFLDYDESTGQWVFAVNHFSRYGILDDDDEDDIIMTETRPLPQAPPQVAVPAPVLKEKQVSQDMNLTHMDMPPADFMYSPASFQVYNTMGLQANALQGMKASLFMDEFDEDSPLAAKEAGWPMVKTPKATYSSASLCPEVEEKKMRMSPPHERLSTQRQQKKTIRVALHTTDEFINKFNKIATISPEIDPLDQAKILHASTKFQPAVVPSEVSIFSQFPEMVPNELGSFNRLKIRPAVQGWTLIRPAQDVKGRSLNITLLGQSQTASSIVFEKLNFKSDPQPLVELMSVEFTNSDIFIERNGLPLYSPKKGVTLMENHIKRLEDFEISEKRNVLDTELFNALTLCDALWGGCVGELSDAIEVDCARKRALSAWITRVTEGVISHEVSLADSPLQAIVSYISGHQISAACEEAVRQGDYNLATLVAQPSHDQTTKEIVRKMCAEWTNSGKDKLIDPERFRIYAMMAGIAQWKISNGFEINVCEGFDWLRCFAIHMWYICPSNLSIAEVVEQYIQACETYAKPPEVKHGDGQSSPLHVCFQLIRLFTDHTQSIGKILSPDTFLSVQCQLQYSHCWLLGLVLESLHYQVPCMEELHVRMASELEAQGLWQWAIFALLHIRDLQKREKCVFDLICLHATSSVDMSEAENFVHCKLQVPKMLIYKAKALRAGYEGRRVNQTKLLILAEELNEAHEILMNHLAVKAIINERFSLLGDLLSRMNADFTKIPSWNHRGRVFFNYIQLTTILREILNARNDEKTVDQILERNNLEGILASLSSKLARLPKDTVEQRLCQIEMAKTTFAAYKNILTLKSASDPHLKNSAIRAVFQLLRKLPLPEDTVAQEFKKLSEEYPEYLPRE